MPEINIQKVKFGSELYQASLELRQRVLRTPLGLELSPEDLDGENEQVHFVLTLHGAVVGCCVLKGEARGVCKLRQMAVDSKVQNQGFGKALLQAAESYAAEGHYQMLLLHSRSTAISFYTDNGYTPLSTAFSQSGLPHIKMGKSLAQLGRT